MIIGVPVVKNEPERAFVPLRSGRNRSIYALFAIIHLLPSVYLAGVVVIKVTQLAT